MGVNTHFSKGRGLNHSRCKQAIFLFCFELSSAWLFFRYLFSWLQTSEPATPTFVRLAVVVVVVDMFESVPLYQCFLKKHFLVSIYFHTSVSTCVNGWFLYVRFFSYFFSASIRKPFPSLHCHSYFCTSLCKSIVFFMLCLCLHFFFLPTLVKALFPLIRLFHSSLRSSFRVLFPSIHFLLYFRYFFRLLWDFGQNIWQFIPSLCSFFFKAGDQPVHTTSTLYTRIGPSGSAS